MYMIIKVFYKYIIFSQKCQNNYSIFNKFSVFFPKIIITFS